MKSDSEIGVFYAIRDEKKRNPFVSQIILCQKENKNVC